MAATCVDPLAHLGRLGSHNTTSFDSGGPLAGVEYRSVVCGS